MGFWSFARRLRRGLFFGTLSAAIGLGGANSAENTQYTYDALGRVVSAIDASGKKVAYTYDSAGNRTRVSNGAEFSEITPTAFTASTNAGTTGLSVAGAMKDNGFTALASIHATQVETGAWVKADLGSAQNVNHIQVAPAVAASVSAGPEDLNGTNVEYSVDGTTWKNSAAVSGAVAGVSQTIALGGVSLRYLRVRRPASGQVAVGDLRFFSAAALGSPLIANPDSISNNGAASITFNPKANDSSFGAVAFTISAVEDPPHGQAIINAGATITYIPDIGYVGGDTFSYTIADGANAVASAQIFVNVTSAAVANRNPVAVNDNATVGDRLNGIVSGTTYLRPLANDYDIDRDTLSISSVTAAGHGIAALSGSTQVSYQPTIGYAGADSFTYTVSDGRGGTASATFSLTIANDAPSVLDDSVAIVRNTPISISPLENDSDANGDTLAISAVGIPAHGTSTAIPGTSATQISYNPQTDYVGPDSFTYTVSDGRGGLTVGSIALTILPSGLSTLEVMQRSVYASSVAIVGGVFTSPTSSSVNVYVDKPMTTGKFYWEVKLLCGNLNPGVSSDVNLANFRGGATNKNAGIDTYTAQTWTTSATASGFTAGVLNDIYGFALDADAKTLKIYKNNVAGPTLALPFSPPYFAHSGLYDWTSISGQSCASPVSKGEFLVGSGSAVYSPPSGFSHLSTAIVNVAPIANDDQISIPTNAWITIDPRLNDVDQNGDGLTISVLGAPAHGSVVNNGTSVRYTPTTAYTGSDSFTYTIADGRGGTASATVLMTVTAAVAKSFSISPAVAGKTTWNLATDGALDLSTAGKWTIVPNATFSVNSKAWGGSGANGGGGGGGYSGGNLILYAGASYTIAVGGGGGGWPYCFVAGANGGGRGGAATSYGCGGGGYSGVSFTGGASIAIAGGGGGHGAGGGYGGAGGGTTGQNGVASTDGAGGLGGMLAYGSPTYLGADGATDGNVGAGGGGGGYNGGQGGSPNSTSSGAGGGGGGSGYADTLNIAGPVLTAGSGTTSGNSGDADRGSSGENGQAGKVKISP